MFWKELIKLNNLNLKNIAENLIDSFLKAGKIAQEISRRGVKITIKADKSPVTDGDLAVDESTPPDIATTTFVFFGVFTSQIEFVFFTELFIKYCICFII